jgi:tRNA threonylcarbamoyladenosine biosynthesis protein TsaE
MSSTDLRSPLPPGEGQGEGRSSPLPTNLRSVPGEGQGEGLGASAVPPNPLVYDSPSESATAVLGAALAEVLPGGTTVALCGTLGAGKTRLVQAIAEAAGVERRKVVSPTFVLVQEYHGRRPVYHVDVYRLRSVEEFLDLGPDDYFESDGLVLVEWADRVRDQLPSERIEINIDLTGPDSRRFTIAAVGERYAAVLSDLAAVLARRAMPSQ